MSNSPGGGRESPSSTTSSTTASGSGSVILSLGSGSNGGCRNSGASFDSGRATASSSTTFQGVRYSAESSLGAFRHSYHSSNSSLGSLPSEEIRNFDVGAMLSQGVPETEILNAWLSSMHLECYYQNFVQAGYDMITIARMTPEDLNAIGVTKPHHRKKIKSEISQLNISQGLPDFIPEAIEDWLGLLKLDEYLPRLLDQGYRNVRQVTNITWEDLDDIGILKLGHQKKFMLAIKRVQDILSGKRVPSSNSSYLTNNTITNNDYPALRQMPYSNHSQQQQQQQHQESHYQQIQRHAWPQTQLYHQPHHHHPIQTPPPPPNVSHQIQIHQPPPSQLPLPPPNSRDSSANVHQPLYHPEVISIRVKNGHPGASNSLDSPPEEEPIYGTSSFLPNNNNSSFRSNQSFKSFEEGETPSSPQSNGLMSMTKQSMSNTWTLPRLQKHKPISKVMGGGVKNSNCDSSSNGVAYPINPGPFISPKTQPPPPPRRSFSVGASPQLDEDNLPLPPPPPPEENGPPIINRMMTQSASNLPSASYSNNSSSYPNNYYTSNHAMMGYNNLQQQHNNSTTTRSLVNGQGGGGRSTLPLTRSRDPSPSGGIDTGDLLPTNGFLSKGVRRNGSDASFKSNSSTESESIPFANDNAGTIKQQKPGGQRTTQQSSSEDSSSGGGGDVLTDISCMLSDLTDQLDAILEQERSTGKRST